MFNKKLKKPVTAFLVALSILLTVFAVSSNLASASDGSISQANTYPQEDSTYLAVDHFTYQLSAIDTNTTVSVSIDNEPPAPMVFEGIQNIVANDDAVANWYTWQTTVPAITEPGNHTFQFFSHYYVWQDSDQYWAEFNARSTVYSFTIKGDPSTQATTSPTATTIAPQLQATPEVQPWIILPFMAAATLSLVFVRKRIPKK
jgi:hypothetical protein